MNSHGCLGCTITFMVRMAVTVSNLVNMILLWCYYGIWKGFNFIAFV